MVKEEAKEPSSCLHRPELYAGEQPHRRHINHRKPAGNIITLNEPTISCVPNIGKHQSICSRSHPTPYATNTEKRLHATSKHRIQTNMNIPQSGINPSFREPKRFRLRSFIRTKMTELYPKTGSVKRRKPPLSGSKPATTGL
ncbi:hypothetical protein F2Q70_00040221 [Brassica cretica]|uniref:Uncharacterized protein n=2 Tax=Brassica TaxID=3705 RepID=A0A8S9K0R5_BRACR|nr:hypothetical protein F2Q70_00040221 [Brassica cretica]CAF2109478.1 unnamed protein product [Brassica napus]